MSKSKKRGNRCIIATRGSTLALWQAHLVKTQLEQHHPELTVAIMAITTDGDRHPNVALTHIGGKYLFTETLQTALLNRQADIAVHSVKDMGCRITRGLCLTAILEREDPRDVLLSPSSGWSDLRQGATVGTASPRRQSQLLHARPDLSIRLLRGNVETRIKKLTHPYYQSTHYDAIVLAAAGLKRLDLTESIRHYFDVETLLPAIGQGAIGIECRNNDGRMQALVAPLDHAITHACVTAERAVNAILGGSCFMPIAAHASYDKDAHEHEQLTLRAQVGSIDGCEIIHAHATGSIEDPMDLGHTVAEDLIAQGALTLIERISS